MTGMRGVVVTYVHPGWVQHTFMQSLMLALSHDRSSDGPVIVGVMPVRFRPAGIAHVRNQAVAEFLAGDGEWLWFVDTDMGFRADALHQLLATADPRERPVVGALCYGVVEGEPDGMGGVATRVFPTLHGRAEEAKVFTEWEGPVPSGLVRVAGTGAACLLVHRSALDRVEYGSWFDPVVDGAGNLVGEDLSFCWRLGCVGVPVHVDCAVPTVHQKSVWLRGGV